MTRVRIDLSHVSTEAEVLDAFGEALQFGGPDGNAPAAGAAHGSGWGKNWDAFADCMSCLDAGGIWGTAPKVEFPLVLELASFETYESNGKPAWPMLRACLEDTMQVYARAGMSFTYVCV